MTIIIIIIVIIIIIIIISTSTDSICQEYFMLYLMDDLAIKFVNKFLLSKRMPMTSLITLLAEIAGEILTLGICALPLSIFLHSTPQRPRAC